MSKVFDFSGREDCEETIQKNWKEFREALRMNLFSFNEVEKAKETTFLNAYDNMFCQYPEYNTTTLKAIDKCVFGRGSVLKENEALNYERFIPKKEFIKDDNRFSPPKVEWLYLALGNEEDIHKCAQAECRAKKGDRFGFCHFDFNKDSLELKLVDLTIADDVSYRELDRSLENHAQLFKKIVAIIGTTESNVNVVTKKIEREFVKYIVYIYSKLLSEQIFVPLRDNDNKKIMYAPFQTLAQYYISLGYAGIIYGSTVSDTGRNIVLFDKNAAYPVGSIEDYMV